MGGWALRGGAGGWASWPIHFDYWLYWLFWWIVCALKINLTCSYCDDLCISRCVAACGRFMELAVWERKRTGDTTQSAVAWIHLLPRARLSYLRQHLCRQRRAKYRPTFHALVNTSADLCRLIEHFVAVWWLTCSDIQSTLLFSLHYFSYVVEIRCFSLARSSVCIVSSALDFVAAHVRHFYNLLIRATLHSDRLVF